MKEVDFCTPFIKPPSKSLLRFFNILSFFLVIFFQACTEKPSLQKEYEQIAEAAAKLGDAKVYILEVDSSYVTWNTRNSKGQDLKGRFQPSKGTLVIEKGSIIGGYIEGDLWEGNQATVKPTFDRIKEKKMLFDSFPVLNSEAGRKIRLDVTQSGRSVVRSEFRQLDANSSQSIPIYLVQANLTLADSVLSVNLPMKLESRRGRIGLNGSYTLNVRDFGIFSMVKNPMSVPPWTPEFPLAIHLLFKPLK